MQTQNMTIKWISCVWLERPGSKVEVPSEWAGDISVVSVDATSEWAGGISVVWVVATNR